MADKQAFVYIIDQGASMGEKHNGRDESDLDYGMRYIWDKIATTLSAGRKTFTVGIVGLRTDETKNSLSAEDAYDHISVMQDLAPMYMPDLRRLQSAIRISDTEVGDAISAIAIAIDMIEVFAKKLKYERKIVLMTNGRGSMDSDGLDDIAKHLSTVGIQLVVVGIDFDDAEYGFKEEDKDSLKKENEAILKSMVDQCDEGIFATAAEAIENLSLPTVKESKPYASYKAKLTLGDPEKYNSAMAIDIERYFRTKVAKPPSASGYVIAVQDDTSQAVQMKLEDNDVEMRDANGSTGLNVVTNERTYKVNDESAVGGKRDVKREDLAKGYEYGRTAVHISESDENVTKLETTPSFSIIGFVPWDNYDRFLNMGESEVIVASRVNEKAQIALSSLIHALHELESYAIARIVKKENQAPKIVLLAPSIEADMECLIDLPLPFAEDVRSYRFPPLDRVVTMTGQVLKTHRNLPSDELVSAMDAYVDSMDLSSFDRDDEGNPAEYMQIDETYSPVLHRISQAVRRRAVAPSSTLPPIPSILTRFSAPSQDLLTTSAPQLAKLRTAAGVTKVPPKTKGRRTRSAVPAPLSGLDLADLLGTTAAPASHAISADNAIPEFKQRIAQTDSEAQVRELASQMGRVVRDFVKNSVGDSGYERALEHLGVARDEVLDLEMAAVYNELVEGLRVDVLEARLGGERREVVWLMRRRGLGLITEARCPGGVSEVEEKAFWLLKGNVEDLAHRAK